MHQGIKDTITPSLWLMTEGRISTDNINESYIIGFKPSMWSSFHQLLEIKGISGFTCHHMASCYQLHLGHTYHFDPIEMRDQVVTNCKGDISTIYEQDSWASGVIWDYHVPVTIDRAMKDDRTEHLMKNIADSIGHAGLHLLCSSSPLEASVKQGIIDACLASGTTIASPSTIPGQRFRAHPEHHIYPKEMLEYIRDNHRPSKGEHPSVPYHFDEPMDEIDETI